MAQDTLPVEFYRRETSWDLEVYTGLEVSLILQSIDLSLTV